jgi:signal transduction histidine kinase
MLCSRRIPPKIGDVMKIKLADDRPLLTRERSADLVRANEELRQQIAELKRENADLTRRFAQARIASSAERESRRAALNLMEDAVEARRAATMENAERRRAEEELRTADRRKDEFLAMLAHELRNPLAPIRNGLVVLKSGEVDQATGDQLFAMIERQVNHLVRLVDDLLEISRITRGQVELRKERVDLQTIVTGAIEAGKPVIEQMEHHLTTDIPADPIVLHADPVRMTQIVTNLLNNAAKYTPRGGEIRLSASCDESNVVISVKDNGIGIPEGMLSQVFEPFVQVDHSIARSYGGLGIGLTLVRTLAERHGGTIECRSEGEGKGTEFIVTLPLADRPA